MTEQAETIDIDGLVQTLLEQMEETETDEAVHAALLVQAEKIRIISQACENTGLFARSASKFEEFKAELESTTEPDRRLLQAWQWFLNRMVESPTRLHMIGAVRLCVPLVACYLPTESA